MNDGVGVLADRIAIEDLCTRYARALDTRDWKLLRTCFTEDARIDYEGMEPVFGHDALEQVCRSALDPLDASQHFIGNVSVEIYGDEATASCYLHAQHVRAGSTGGDKYVVAGTYFDTLRRAADGWRITHRRLDVVWTDGNPSVLGE